MKNQKAFLTLVLCLVSSFASADSPTDAPLLPNDANAIVAQRGQNDVKEHKQRDKKVKCAAKNVAQSASDRASAPATDDGKRGVRTDTSASF